MERERYYRVPGKENLKDRDYRRFVVNMAISSPDDLRLLFERLYPERVKCNANAITPKAEVESHELPWLLRLIMRLRKAKAEEDTVGQERARDELNSHIRKMDDFIGRFVSMCVESFCNADEPHFSDMEFDKYSSMQQVGGVYGNGLFDTIIHLYQTSSEATKERFARHFLTPEEMAHYSDVKIIVSKEDDLRKVRGNSGRYVILTQKKHHPPMPLKFTHQASAVYYLMYLIDRCNGYHGPVHIDLARNKETFMRLYRLAYDISQEELEHRFQTLLYREESGFLRSGREKELSYDIRRCLWKRFSEYDENPAPYVIEANGHLSIRPYHILFEDNSLLDFHFH